MPPKVVKKKKKKAVGAGKATTTKRKKKKKSTDESKGGESKANGAEEDPVLREPRVSVEDVKARLRAMKQEADAETKMMNMYQQEKEALEQFWEAEKERKEADAQVLREKLRQKDELADRQAFELNIYKQKVKNLLLEQQGATTGAVIDAETGLTMVAEDRRDDAHVLNLNLREIHQRRKEVERAHWTFVNNIKQEQERHIMELREEFERKSRELQAIFQKKEKEVRQEYQEQRKADIKAITDRKDTHIRKLMSRHKQAFDDIKNYYRDITHHNLDLIKQLKSKVQHQQKLQQKKDKEVSDISRMHKKLSQPLQHNLELLDKLKADEKSYERERVALQAANHKLIFLEQQVKNATWEYDILEQKFSQLQEERDELREALQNSLFDAQQKVGFQNLIMERKLALLHDQLEKTDASIAEILKKVHLDPEVVGEVRHNLTDVIGAKDEQIAQLEEQLQFMKQEYYDCIHTYESKLDEYDIPLEDVGFTPPQL